MMFALHVANPTVIFIVSGQAISRIIELLRTRLECTYGIRMCHGAKHREANGYEGRMHRIKDNWNAFAIHI